MLKASPFKGHLRQRSSPLLFRMTSEISDGALKKGVFVQKLKPLLGRMDWALQAPDYDYRQEIARAAFADMLHDQERNRLYYEGLRAAIAKKRREGQRVDVLDIGTGTGLLAMMAARLGADSVTAIEEFGPMANCAEKVIKANGYADKIKLIRKRSTEVSVKGEGDLDAVMESRANILVTEVFDTELIGEAATSTFNHAHRCLLTKDCLVVPCFGRMYVQVVESNIASRWNRLHPIQLEEQGGAASCLQWGEDWEISPLALHDLQLTQLEEVDSFKVLTAPVPVFEFDFGWSRGTPLKVKEQTVKFADLKDSGRCDALFMWWEVYMDPEKTVLLSCAPRWAHPVYKDTPELLLPWRDHWLQAIYYPVGGSAVVDKEKHGGLTITSSHDEFSLWFDVCPSSSKDAGCPASPAAAMDSAPALPMPGPGSSRAKTLTVSRTRLGQMNDPLRNKKLIRAVRGAFQRFASAHNRPPSTVLCLGEESLLPAIAMGLLDKLGASGSSVFFCDSNRSIKSVLSGFGATMRSAGSSNQLVDIGRVEDLTRDSLPSQVDVVIGEPHFSFSHLPWHNLFFWISLDNLFGGTKGAGGGRPWATLPRGGELWAVAVHFRDLHKIRCPVHKAEGFDLKHFDDLIMESCNVSDSCTEAQPLWEYPCVALSSPAKLMGFDFMRSVTPNSSSVTLDLLVDHHSGVDADLNGMALWMEWDLDGEERLGCGPTEDIRIGQKISWDIHSKQGIHIFPEPGALPQCNPRPISAVRCRTTFSPLEGDLSFSFEALRD